MNSTPRILVMMATYNGEQYLPEQIESILAQDDVDVTLMICDDGSTDGTCAICSDVARRSERIVFRRNAANKGLGQNFMDMVYSNESGGYDLYAFSDQDDVWLPDKLRHAANMLAATMNVPSLYYSDVENVDELLQGGAREYAGFAGCAHSMVALLAVNWASGCTMVFNEKLRNLLLAYRPPAYDRIHDGWVHLVALSCGVVIPDLGNSRIKRRISGRNQVGVRNLTETESLGESRKRWRRLLRESEHVQTATADYLLDGYLDYMTPDMIAIVRDFSRMPQSFEARLRTARRLLSCGFPNSSMGKTFALKALLNRL